MFWNSSKFDYIIDQETLLYMHLCKRTILDTLQSLGMALNLLECVPLIRYGRNQLIRNTLKRNYKLILLKFRENGAEISQLCPFCKCSEVNLCIRYLPFQKQTKKRTEKQTKLDGLPLWRPSNMRSNNRSLLTSSLFKDARSGIHPVNAPKSMFWGKKQVCLLNHEHKEIYDLVT